MTKAKLFSLVDDCDNIHSGTCGTVYINFYGNAIKILNSPLHLTKLPMADYSSKLIAFPMDTYFSRKDKIIGYKMRAFKGDTLKYGFGLSYNIENIRNAYLETKKEISKFKNIKMIDLSEVNIMFDGNHFYLIDTDDWVIHSGNVRSNQNYFKAGIIEGLILSIKSFRKQGDIFNDLVKGSISINQVFDMICEKYVKITGNIPRTIEDLISIDYDIDIHSFIKR